MKPAVGFKESLRLYSVRLMALFGGLAAAWPMLPEELRAWIPEEWKPAIVVVMFLSIYVARLVPQDKK